MAPAINGRRFRFPNGGVLNPWKLSQGSELGCHRDPIIGFGHHCGFASNRIAQHGKAVTCPHGKGIEAVQVADGGFQRLGDGRALPQPLAQISRSHLAIVIGLEGDVGVIAEPIAKTVMVRQGPVVDKT